MCVFSFPNLRLRIIYKKVFARQRRPRRTADFSQFPGVTIPENTLANASGQSGNSGGVASGDGAGAIASGSAADADDKSSVGKYEEDEEFEDEEDEDSDVEDDEEGSSAGRDNDGDEDNEEIDIRQFEGEPIIPNKQSADEQIAFCVKVSSVVTWTRQATSLTYAVAPVFCILL